MLGLIVNKCSEFYEELPGDVVAHGRRANLVRARHMAMYVLHRTGCYTQADIGAFFQCDHATVTHALRKMREQCSANDVDKNAFHYLLGLAKNVLKMEIAPGSGYVGETSIATYELDLTDDEQAWFHWMLSKLYHTGDTIKTWLLDVRAIHQSWAEGRLGAGSERLQKIVNEVKDSHQYVLIRVKEKQRGKIKDKAISHDKANPKAAARVLSKVEEGRLQGVESGGYAVVCPPKWPSL